MKRHCVAIALPALVILFVLATPARADLVVFIGDAEAIIAPGIGETTASFDIDFENTMDSTAGIIDYTLFLDIEPADFGLPEGVKFAASPVTYVWPAGTNTAALNPAAGDLGLGQQGFFSIDANDRTTAMTIHLEIDRSVAVPGVYSIGLNAAGENRFNLGAGGLQTTVPFTGGTLTLSAVPEPGAWLFLLAASACVGAIAIWQRKRPADSGGRRGASQPDLNEERLRNAGPSRTSIYSYLRR